MTFNTIKMGVSKTPLGVSPAFSRITPFYTLQRVSFWNMQGDTPKDVAGVLETPLL